jgi:hypothetical protein
VWLPALIMVIPSGASASRNAARSRVLKTIPICGKLIRKAQINWASSRSVIENAG